MDDTPRREPFARFRVASLDQGHENRSGLCVLHTHYPYIGFKPSARGLPQARRSHVERAVCGAEQGESMTERYFFIAGFRNLFGLQRVVNDGDYGDRVAEGAEEFKE